MNGFITLENLFGATILTHLRLFCEDDHISRFINKVSKKLSGKSQIQRGRTCDNDSWLSPFHLLFQILQIINGFNMLKSKRIIINILKPAFKVQPT
jgi:hypothetical protein